MDDLQDFGKFFRGLPRSGWVDARLPWDVQNSNTTCRPNTNINLLNMGFPVHIAQTELPNLIEQQAINESDYLLGKTAFNNKAPDAIIKILDSNQEMVENFMRVFHSEEPSILDYKGVTTLPERHAMVGLALYGPKNSHLYGAQVYLKNIADEKPIIMSKEFAIGLIESMLVEEGIDHSTIDKAVAEMNKMADGSGLIEIQPQDADEFANAIRTIILTTKTEHMSIVNGNRRFERMYSEPVKTLSIQEHTMGMSFTADSDPLCKWSQSL